MSFAALNLQPDAVLPVDAAQAALAARVWLPDWRGPAVAAVRGDDLVDVSARFRTMRDLCETPDPAAALRGASGPVIGKLADILANSDEDHRDAAKPWLLAPVDLQAIKAAGVTFPRSMLERVIEEQAKGAPE